MFKKIIDFFKKDSFENVDDIINNIDNMDYFKVVEIAKKMNPEDRRNLIDRLREMSINGILTTEIKNGKIVFILKKNGDFG